MDPRFVTTQWSLVVAACRTERSAAQEALASLCSAYWYPLYNYVRRRGHRADEAADLVQGYFVKLLDKEYLKDVRPYSGRFRAFLLASLKNYLCNEWTKERALKRGGHLRRVAFDPLQAEGRYQRELVELETPEALYDRRWALAILERALARLESEQAAERKRSRFRALQEFLVVDGEASYSSAAEALDVSEGAVRVAVHRLRKRYGQLVRAEIEETVADPAETEDELQYLVAALADPRTAN